MFQDVFIGILLVGGLTLSLYTFNLWKRLNKHKEDAEELTKNQFDLADQINRLTEENKNLIPEFKSSDEDYLRYKKAFDSLESERLLAIAHFKEKDEDFCKYKKAFDNLENEKFLAISKFKDSDEEYLKYKKTFDTLESIKATTINDFKKYDEDYKQMAFVYSRLDAIKEESYKSGKECQQIEDKPIIDGLQSKIEELTKQNAELINSYSSLNSQYVGFNFQEWCQNQMVVALDKIPTVKFSLDKKAPDEKKADFVVKFLQDDLTTCNFTVVIECKTKCTDTNNKQKNSSFMEKLLTDTKKSKAQFGLLVTTLEADKDFKLNAWNMNIPDTVKLFICRPEYLTSFLISLSIYNDQLNKNIHKKQRLDAADLFMKGFEDIRDDIVALAASNNKRFEAIYKNYEELYKKIKTGHEYVVKYNEFLGKLPVKLEKTFNKHISPKKYKQLMSSSNADIENTLSLSQEIEMENIKEVELATPTSEDDVF